MFDEQDDLLQRGTPPDLTALPNYGGTPNVLDPMKGASPSPDFSDLFEQQVMKQLRENSPEEIRKRKVKEYFDKIGLKPDTKMGKLGSFFKEASTAYTAGQNKEKYTPLEDRLTNESRAEYERMLPGIRNEASTLYTNKRAEEANRSHERVAQLKAEEDRRKTEMTERIKSADIAVKNNVQGALANKYREQTEGMAQLRKALEKDPKYALATKEMKNFMAAQAYKKEYGTDFDSALTDASAFTTAMAQPSREKTITGTSDDEWSKMLGRIRANEAAKKEGKFAPSSRSGNMRIIMMNKTSDDGTISQVPAFIDPRNPTGGAQEIVSGDPNLKPNDSRIRGIAERFKASHTQARAAFGEVTSAVQTGRDKDFIGPAAANPIIKNLRLMGFKGDKSAPESLSDALMSNALSMHTQGMMGGGTRYAYQALEDFKKRIASEHTASPRSLMYGMGALNYSIELGLMENSGKLKDTSVDNILMQVINRELDKSISRAYSDRITRKKSAISLRPLADLVADADKIRGGPVAGTSKVDDVVNSVLGK